MQSFRITLVLGLRVLLPSGRDIHLQYVSMVAFFKKSNGSLTLLGIPDRIWCPHHSSVFVVYLHNAFCTPVDEICTLPDEDTERSIPLS